MVGESTTHEMDRADYVAFCQEYGFTEAELQRMTLYDQDQIPMPQGYDAVRLANSDLHGMGMFATRDVRAGEWLAPARFGLKRTPAGRYTNHARHPNCAFIQAGPDVPAAIADIWLVATEGVQAGEELTVSYRQAGQVNGHGRKPVTAEKSNGKA